MPTVPDSTDRDSDHDFNANGSGPASRVAGTGKLTPTGKAKVTAGGSSGLATHRHRAHAWGGTGGSRSKSRTKKIGQLRLMVSLLVAVSMFTTMAAVYYWAKIDTLDVEMLSLSVDLSHAQKELEEARQLLRQQDNEISAMLAKRIPGVAQIAFDTLFNLDDKYLHKLTFSRSGIGANKGTEFHVVLENKTTAPIQPDVRIILFDRMGLQVDVVKIGKNHSTNSAATDELQADETRTYSGTFLADQGAEPKYFLVQVR